MYLFILFIVSLPFSNSREGFFFFNSFFYFCVTGAENSYLAYDRNFKHYVGYFKQNYVNY